MGTLKQRWAQWKKVGTLIVSCSLLYNSCISLQDSKKGPRSKHRWHNYSMPFNTILINFYYLILFKINCSFTAWCGGIYSKDFSLVHVAGAWICISSIIMHSGLISKVCCYQYVSSVIPEFCFENEFLLKNWYLFQMIDKCYKNNEISPFPVHCPAFILNGFACLANFSEWILHFRVGSFYSLPKCPNGLNFGCWLLIRGRRMGKSGPRAW